MNLTQINIVFNKLPTLVWHGREKYCNIKPITKKTCIRKFRATTLYPGHKISKFKNTLTRIGFYRTYTYSLLKFHLFIEKIYLK